MLQPDHQRSLEPSRDGSSRPLSDLEADGPLGLALDDRSAELDLSGRIHVSDLHFHQVTSSQLAVDREIEERKHAGPLSDLEADPDRLYMLWFERTLLTNDAAFVPSGAAGADGSQVCSRHDGSSDPPRPPRLRHHVDSRTYQICRAAVRLWRAEPAAPPHDG